MALWRVKAEYRVRMRGALRAGAAIAMLGTLGACSVVPDWASPVQWYRDVAGVSKDDAPPDATNAQNLAKGSQEPYPNLASVPPPPTNALSAADRDRLRNSLSADQANAKYVENNEAYQPVPPTDAPSPTASKPVPIPSTPAAAAPAPTPSPTATAPVASAATQTPPRESPLTPPSVRSVPQGETPRAPPPAPPGVATGSRPAPQQSAALPPSRSAPTLSPPPSSDAGVAAPPTVSVVVGTLEFAGNSNKLSADDLQQLRDVAQLSRQNGGIIRVTAYSDPSGMGATANRELANFNLALDRARAVAVALTQIGVSARAVEISASPAPPGQRGGTVELSLEY
jgi:outer membrane protein OmpA-like peptidoglycan-associated protein